MNPTEVHVMQSAWIAERQTMRYHCPTCQRCLEDGPEGLRLLAKGDQQAQHVGGLLSTLHLEIEQAPAPPPLLH